MNIEQDLRQALARKAAPPDFAERVLARIHEAPATAAPPRTPFTRHWLAAAAAAVVVATAGARYYAHQQTVAEAERVKQEIGLALRITSEKLALVQRRIDASVEEPRQGNP